LTGKIDAILELWYDVIIPVIDNGNDNSDFRELQRPIFKRYVMRDFLWSRITHHDNTPQNPKEPKV
jgi:hypothetical protein